MSTHAAQQPGIKNNRIIAVDTVRILAATVAMMLHLYVFPVPLAKKYCIQAEWLFGEPTALFFLLAGYFACRNITWKKALLNAWWSFAPFVLWNGVCIIVWFYAGLIDESKSFFSHWGVSNFFLKGFTFLDVTHPGRPLNAPLWFMRDLTVLFLLSPLLSKVSRWLFPTLLLASLVPSLSGLFTHVHYRALLSPYSLSFFTAGCFLMSLGKDKQRKALSYYNIWIILIFPIVAFIRYRLSPGFPPLCFNLFMAWVLYQTARMLSVKVPGIDELSLKYAPVTFLTFATHWILWPFLPVHNIFIALLCPFATFAGLAVFFFAMKRWAPCLLHLVAHYKLRPEDLKPKKEETSLG